MITAKQANKLLLIDGKPVSHMTFDRLVNEGILKPKVRVVGGIRLFDQADVVRLSKRLPKTSPPNRLGIVNWLKGQRLKSQL